MLTGWHGTVADFESFDEAWFGSCADRSPNGRLGVWMYLREGLAENAGHRVLRIEADVSEAQVARFTSNDMMRDHLAAQRMDDPHSYFDAIRTRLRAEGKRAILVHERDGEALIAVILDLDCIATVEDLSPGPAFR